MGAVRPAGLALVASLLLFWNALTPAAGPASAGHMVVSTDYELFGTSDLRGGGHVTWTLTGVYAADFRAKILHLFDEYGQIPRGFLFAGQPTSANVDGTLESAEGVRYTDLLENVLEGSGSATGTLAQYVEMYPFDLREKNANEALGFERSTSGLANTNLSASADVEIRFLFEANTTTSNARVRLATDVLAQSLYRVFAYQAVQAPNMTASAPSSAWPFLPPSGTWHVVTVDGRGALWAGNLSTGLYDNGTQAYALTSADPGLVSLSPIYEPFDLRFASNATATFNYTGQRADTGDRLRLEIAPYPLYTNWTALSFGASRDLPPTPVGTWANASVDLSGYLGARVRLRLNFTSDGAGSAPGFFLRDFALRAPSVYDGPVLEADTHYLVGTLSFSDPVIPSGGIQLVRTPGGEILWYSSEWPASTRPADSIVFRTFDVTENPQVLFGIMLVASYLISRLQDSAYDRYREAHPSVYRPAVHKARWLHRLGKVAIAVLVLFYFVPTALWVIGLRVFVSGVAYWFLSLTLALLLGLGTRAYYRQRLEEAPPPVVGEAFEAPRAGGAAPAVPGEGPSVAHCTHCLREIREGDKTYTCTCGAPYHLSCAASLMRCSNCRKPVAIEVVRKEKQVSLRCESCGELQTVAEGTDPRTVTCANCGGRLRHLDTGKRYLIVASNPALAFAWMKDLTKGGKPALCFSPAAPERLRLEFSLKGVEILRVSSQGADAVDPKKLDPAGLKAILPLARAGQGGVILYDGLDQMVAESSTGDVIRFLRKANDMAFVHAVTVIARVAPGRLADPELRRLRAEFDEFMDLSAQL